MERLSKKLPRWVKEPIKKVAMAVRAVPHYGTGRDCPVCGKSAKRFLPYGGIRRPDAQCPHCGALERHRYLWIYFTEHTDLFDGKDKKVLHVAPEECFEQRFKTRLGNSYITADLISPRATVKMDITDIQYPDETFDVIYCSHVLEHVVEDRKAMGEFYRTLKNDGWAVLLVPISRETTFEDPSINDPEARLAAFGHRGHVRRYGKDYVDRLRETGFKVSIIAVDEIVPKKDAERMGLTFASGKVYHCTK